MLPPPEKYGREGGGISIHSRLGRIGKVGWGGVGSAIPPSLLPNQFLVLKHSFSNYLWPFLS